MSQKGTSNTQLITAGLLGVGVGVLAASVGYAIATCSPSNNRSKTPERRIGRGIHDEGNITHEIGANEGLGYQDNNGSQCNICRNDITLEPSITLDCSHLYHRKCLFSSYVVQTQMNTSTTFKCPINTCKAAISNRILESLIVLH